MRQEHGRKGKGDRVVMGAIERGGGNRGPPAGELVGEVCRVEWRATGTEKALTGGQVRAAQGAHALGHDPVHAE